MPLIIDGGRIPAGWAEREGWRAGLSADRSDSRRQSASKIARSLTIECRTRLWKTRSCNFFELLNAAAEDSLVLVKLFSLPKIPRSDRGQEHLQMLFTSASKISEAASLTVSSLQEPNRTTRTCSRNHTGPAGRCP